jgi:WD40 repeat protein
VIDTRDGHLIRTGPSILELRSDDIRQVAISDRLDQVLVLGNQQSRLRDLGTGRVRDLPGLGTVSFGGSLIGYTTLEGKLEIRDVHTWRLIGAVPDPALAGPALSRDGRRYAFQRDDGTVEVRDTASGDLLLSFGLPSSIEGIRTSLAFSLDGSRLFTVTEGNGDTDPGQAQEWTLDPQIQSATGCAAAGRNLAAAEVSDLVGTVPDGLGKCPTASFNTAFGNHGW